MRNIIEAAVEWEKITDGRVDRDKFTYSLEKGIINKDSGALVVPMTLNFIMPFDSLLKLKAVIKSKLPLVNDVKIKFNFENLILTKEEIIRNYIPYMISLLDGPYAPFTKSIDGGSLYIRSASEEDGREKVFCEIGCLGKTSEDKLNKYVKREFERIIKKTFLIDAEFLFKNNEELYREIASSFSESEMKEIKECIEEQAAKHTERVKTGSTPDSYRDGEKQMKAPQNNWRNRQGGEKERNGNFIMGRPMSGEANAVISMLDPKMGDVIVEGTLFKIESKLIRAGLYIASVLVTDEINSVCCKLFVSDRKLAEMEDFFEYGCRVKVFGQVEFDQYENLNIIKAKEIEKLEVEEVSTDDSEIGKRVELHLHTKMSQMDGFNEPEEAVRRAALWGQPAIAITDHGVVQSFPDAFKEAQKQTEKGRPIKVIFGLEGYVFDDSDCIDENGVIDYRKKPVNHIIILAKTQDGLKNLYKLVSYSHLNYFYRKPRIPWSVLEAHREGLIVGSACCFGEVYSSLVTHVYKEKRTGTIKRTEALSEDELLKLASRYDYLEIQPVINNKFMLEGEYLFEGKRVESFDDIREINKKVLSLADKLGKPCIATCDAHYGKPDAALYRNILMASMGFEDAESGEGLYMRTTGEMMEEFSYLGERAKEVVIDNSNLIANMVSPDILPVPKGKYPPKIEGDKEKLRTICMDRLHQKYGPNPREEVVERLEKELNSVIDNGYAVMYVSAQMLVKKSNEDGYLVGSRGSVGSSFAATMAGITEVNPLNPHYICPNCYYFEWGNIEKYDCGVDMPPMDCPECGAPMDRDGYTIPFATFLGFNGDKEPDIDLNFAGEYQATAHRYVAEIFGEKNVFKAGTVGTIAEKTAEDFVRKFYEAKGLSLNKYEAERLTTQCLGVKRTTGQHPGGIVICPDDHEIFEFCPIQHPANDSNSGVVTTHFDYHKIDENLLKLDILGHDVPSMIRQLQDLTGVDPIKIDLSDKTVLSIFNGRGALNIKDKDYRFTHGSYGIPEFGTSFTRQMLVDTQPDKFADLVRISGFSHGENVWLNNAQDYIRSKQATMREVISTRDDIMNYLILKGVDQSQAFKIMEIVRKGKHDLTEEQVKTMKEHNVPQWYIDSCNKIKYMFPRAHAVAYTMMSFRIAWYKVYYPEAFYATYFTSKADDFDAVTMLGGKSAILEKIDDFNRKGGGLTAKEKGQLTLLEVGYEMYARDIEFAPPSLEHSEAKRFTVVDGKIMLPFLAVSGVGSNAAQQLYDAYKEKPFSTIEEAMQRGKINKTSMQVLRDFGVFGDLPETDQLTMFM